MRIAAVATFLIGSLTTASAQNVITNRYFTDANGNTVGSAMTNNVTGQTYFSDAQGMPAGSASPGLRGQTNFYDRDGNPAGSIQGPILGDD